MGTAYIPMYANLFLAKYKEAPLLEMKDTIYYYGRFIDDVFAIIKGSLSHVQCF